MSYVHTRTVEINYDFGFSSSEKDLLHLALKNVGIVNMSKYDDDITAIQYDEKEVIDKDYQYKVITDDGVALTFLSSRTADKVKDQYTEQGVAYTSEDITVETKRMSSPSWRGECLMLEGVPHDISWRENKHVITTNDVGETDVSLSVFFSCYTFSSTLKFVVEFPTERVQKDSVLEEKLVELPTPLMGKIQALFEDTVSSESFDKTIGEPMIDCMFNVVSNHSSECKPSTIAMLREARERASSEEE